MLLRTHSSAYLRLPLIELYIQSYQVFPVGSRMQGIAILHMVLVAYPLYPRTRTIDRT